MTLNESEIFKKGNSIYLAVAISPDSNETFYFFFKNRKDCNG
jgi:hypothetical protein